MLIVGVLIGTGLTAICAGVIAEWNARHAYPPEPQRVMPEHIRPLSDGLASLARTLRLTHSPGADSAATLGHLALNLERAARGLPPMAVPRLGDADVGPLLRRSQPPYQGQP